MSKTKIIILIPCWRRPEIFKLVSDQLHHFVDANKKMYNLTVMYVFSDEDPDIEQLAEIYNTASYKRAYTFCDNYQLGRKHNTGINAACELGFDYLMNMGSDDLLHADLLKLYKPEIDKRTAIFGINKLYFHDKASKRTLFFSYYNNLHVVGAGRMIHKSVINRLHERYGCVYESAAMRGMDGSSADRMHNCGFRQTVIDPGEFPYLVDIKSDENINDFDKILQSENRNGITEVSTEIIRNHFKVNL